MIGERHILSAIILSLSAMVMSSCLKLGQGDMSIGQTEIVIEPITKTHTKAIIDGTVYPNDETIGLWAFYTEAVPNTMWKDAKNSTSIFLDNVAFHKHGSSWAGYDYDTQEHKPYYWLGTGSMFFAAYSPYSLHEEVSYDKVTGGFTLSEYTINSSDYQDFLYAEIADLDYSISNTNKDIVFKHALALIEFNAQLKDADDASYIDVHSVTINSMPSTGSFVSRDTETGGPEWTRNPSPVTELSVCDAGETDGKDNGISLTTEKTLLGQALVIPGNGVQIEVRYRIHYATDKHLTEKYIIIPSDAVPVWKPGYKYTYNLTLGVDYIDVEPKIGVDWDE